MLRSLYAGVSGLKVNQTKMDVIGNNISNVGTTAFKLGRARFQDMVSQSSKSASAPTINTGGVNASQIGLGVQLAGVDTITTQGIMQSTGSPLDDAVDGDGYFMVGKGAAAYSSTPTITVDNSAGNHNITSSGTMEMSYTRDGAFHLDETGNLLNSDGYRVMGYSVTDGTVQSLDDNSGAPAVNYVDGTKTYYADDTGLKSLVIPEKVNMADGTQQRVKTYNIDKTGVITAVLESGGIAILGQIGMASFRNPAGLEKKGGNLYSVSTNSGQPVIRSGINTQQEDNSKGYGNQMGGMLELSNVDLSEQFTDMIVTSRAFQASGKMITTGDEMLQDIINLKR